ALLYHLRRKWVHQPLDAPAFLVRLVQLQDAALLRLDDERVATQPVRAGQALDAQLRAPVLPPVRPRLADRRRGGVPGEGNAWSCRAGEPEQVGLDLPGLVQFQLTQEVDQGGNRLVVLRFGEGQGDTPANLQVGIFQQAADGGSSTRGTAAGERLGREGSFQR